MPNNGFRRERLGGIQLAAHETRRWFRDMAPALAVLLITVVFSLLYGDNAALDRWQTVYKAPLRFLRFAALFSIPLIALPKLYGFITRKKSAVLLQVKQRGVWKIEPIKHWIFRPLQGIGVGLLFGTKLLAILQLIAGPTVDSSLLIPEGRFQTGRLLLVTLITIFVSLLLSTIWTLDDMGIRYFNRKDQELKMIGKYAGTMMPVIFGFYGMVNLFANYSSGEAFLFAFKIAVVLYPPLAVFAVLHTYFLSSRTGLFAKSYLGKGVILQRDE